MRTYLRPIALGFFGAVLAILAYQAYLDHRRIMQHETKIDQIIAFLNTRTPAK